MRERSRPLSRGRKIEARNATIRRADWPSRLVHTGTLMAVPHLLSEHGVDPGPVLLEFGLTQQYLEDLENTIPLLVMGRVLARCSEVTGIEYFGLLAGQRLAAPNLGALGYVVQSAPDVRSALEALVRYIEAHHVDSVLSIVIDGPFVEFGYALLPAEFEGRQHILEGAAALMFNMLRQLCGPQWRASEVRFTCARPINRRHFQDFFGAPLTFGTGETVIVFPAHWMGNPLASADPQLHRMMKRRLESVSVSRQDDIVGHLRAILPTLARDGRLNLDQAARVCGLEPRTLGRRLARDGTRFADLRDEAMLSAATELLASTALSAQEISDRLGFAHAGSFTRAFHRWTGMGPSRWRESRHDRLAQ